MSDISNSDAAKCAELAALLQSDNVTARGNAVSALVLLGPVAIPAVLEAVVQVNLESENWSERLQPGYAAEVLSRFGAVSVPFVVDAINNSSGTARDLLLTMVADLKPPELWLEMAPLLFSIYVERLNLLPGCKLTPSSKSLSALGPFALPHYCEAFAKTEVKGWKILQYFLRKPDAIPILLSNLSHANIAVQANAAAVLLKLTSDALQRIDSHVGDPEPLQKPAVDKLVSLLSDTDEQVRQIALDALSGAQEKFTYLPDLVLPAVLEQILREIQPSTSDAAQESCASQENFATSSTLPVLPTYNFVKTTLERQYDDSTVPATNGNGVQASEGNAINEANSKSSVEADFSACKVEKPLDFRSFGQPSFFKKHIILSVNLRGFRVKTPEGRPSEEMCGLGPATRSNASHCNNTSFYAYDGERMLQLVNTEANRNISEVLRSECLKLEELDAVELAWFFCHMIIRGSHTVVEPAASSDNEPDNEFNDEFYKDSAVSKPAITGNQVDGWKLHFWTMQSYGGCMPSMPNLCEHTVAISGNYYFNHVES